MIRLQTLISALRVKDTTIFELLEQEFYYGDFIFFPQLTAYLGRIANINTRLVKEVGILSELVYLYAKIHGSIATEGTKGEKFCKTVQMPVLLGDLFLGKFYKTLHEYAREDTLTIYLEFMKELNRERIGKLEKPSGEIFNWIALLTETTVNVLCMLAGITAEEKDILYNAAQNFREEYGTVFHEERITGLSALEQRLQAELY